MECWLTTYAGAPENAYTRAAGRLLLLGAVARADHPGIKFDTTIIFEGRQGVGKSRLLRILGGPWTLEGLSARLDKDDVLRMQGHLIVELGEITALRNSELNDLKHFLSTEEDCVRPPYGTEPKVYKRRAIFVGTTNDGTYLKDMTGNRRFLPVRVTRVDHHALEADRDQLWAEAIHEWRSLVARQRARKTPLHEALYLPERLWAVAQAEQEARRTEDPWEIFLGEYLEKFADGEVLTTQALLAEVCGLGARSTTSPREIQRLSRIMAMLGWEKGKYRVNGRPVSGFRRPAREDAGAA
jgi:predicted P-loop ATPase